MQTISRHFLVLGAGVGGICAAIDLAEAGQSVTLVDKGPRTGGILPQLDHQFPDDHCGMCRLLPMVERDDSGQTCLKRGLFHDRIEILTHTRLTGLDGQPGNYAATLTTVSRGIDASRCTRCMACIEACPEMVPDAFNDRVGKRKAIYRPFFGNPEALPTIDWDRCTRCGTCAEACPTTAIDLKRGEAVRTLSPMAGIIVAGGNDRYDPEDTDLYGYGVLPNVVTATGFERLLSGSGPHGGKPVRPSDGRPIRRVAWIQCVGSRNVMIGAPHCSSVCCMFAVKEALLAKQKLGPGTDTAIFYMDMRTYDRDDQRYRDRAEETAGVRFIRCRIHSVEPADDPGDLKLTYLDEGGQPVEAVFDLVVLSTGGTQKKLPDFLADRIEQKGVMILGPEAGLQSIRETVLGAHQAVAEMLRERGGPGDRSDATAIGRAGDPEDGRWRQQPVVQVLLLDHGMDGDDRVDWQAVEVGIGEMAGNHIVNRLTLDNHALLPGLTSCITETPGNRLLIVSDHLGAWRRSLAGTIEAAGFDPLLTEWVDLNRDATGMGHAADSVTTARRSIRTALMRLIHKRPVEAREQPVEKAALVIGAGPAGLSAAVTLAEKGVPVHLVEHAATIGGNGPRIRDARQRRPIEQLMARAEDHPRITLHTAAGIGPVSGAPGRFKGWIVKPDAELPVAFGAAVIATGGGVAPTDAYGLGRHRRLVSHFEFESRTMDEGFAAAPLNTVVMIQCAGSREEPRNYCSRTCCLKNLENAIRVRERFPDARIVVFYRDIMTCGPSESLYAEARARRIRFIAFPKANPPKVLTDQERIIVEGVDPVMGETLRLEADWVSLAVGMTPSPIHDVCRRFAVPVTRDGFVQEADAKWRPVDTINPGVFVCGLAKAPLKALDAVAEGQAAALRALRLIHRNHFSLQRKSALVRHALCSRCHLCVDACPYGARLVLPATGRVEVDPAGCQGCGVCASVCPNSATIMGENEDFTLMGVIEAALD